MPYPQCSHAGAGARALHGGTSGHKKTAGGSTLSGAHEELPLEIVGEIRAGVCSPRRAPGDTHRRFSPLLATTPHLFRTSCEERLCRGARLATRQIALGDSQISLHRAFAAWLREPCSHQGPFPCSTLLLLPSAQT